MLVLIDNLIDFVARLLLGRESGDRDHHRSASLLASGAGGSMAANMSALLIGLGVHLLLARLMGAGSYGVFVVAATWVNVVYVVLCMGYDITAVRFIPSYIARGDYHLLRGFLRAAPRIILLVSTLFLFLALLALWLVQPRFSREMLLCLAAAALLTPLKALAQYLASLLRALKQAVRSILFSRVLGHVLLGCGVVVLWLWPGVDVTAPLAMSANVAGTLLLVLGVAWYLRSEKMLEQSRDLAPLYEHAEWRKVAAPLLVINIFQLILVRTDILMIGAMLTTEEAGIYSVAGQLAVMVMFVLNSANQILAPQIAELHAQNKTEVLQSLMTVAARGILALTLPVVLVLVFAGKWILGWFGPEFPAGYTVMLILASGQMIAVAAGPVGFLLNMTGGQRDSAWVIGVTAVLNIVLNYILIRWYGITGAAVASASVMALRTVLLSLSAGRRLGISSGIFALRGRTSSGQQDS